MKKFRKVLLVFVMLLCAALVASCNNNGHEHNYVEGKCECGEVDPNYVAPDPMAELKTAMAELETANCTINYNMKMVMKMSMDGQTDTETVEMEMYLENDSTKSYIVTTSEGEKVYTYAVIEGDQVKEYVKLEDEWMLLETVNVDEYSSTNDLLDIEVDESFVLEDGVWVGNTEALDKILDKVLESLSSELVGMEGLTMDELSIKKYNITLSEGKVSLVDVEMYFKMTYQGIVIEYDIAMPMSFSKIGSTIVTVPENLPAE